MIKVEGLTKKYGKNLAVNNVSFSVAEGEIVGVLGPNLSLIHICGINVAPTIAEVIKNALSYYYSNMDSLDSISKEGQLNP